MDPRMSSSIIWKSASSTLKGNYWILELSEKDSMFRNLNLKLQTKFKYWSILEPTAKRSMIYIWDLKLQTKFKYWCILEPTAKRSMMNICINSWHHLGTSSGQLHDFNLKLKHTIMEPNEAGAMIIKYYTNFQIIAFPETYNPSIYKQDNIQILYLISIYWWSQTILNKI